MSGRFVREELDGYWTAIKNATGHNTHPSAELAAQVARPGSEMQHSEQLPAPSAANVLMQNIPGVRPQQGVRSYPSEPFDSATPGGSRLPPPSQLLPADQTLQQQQLPPNFQYSPAGKPNSSDFKTASMPGLQQANSSGSNEEDKAQGMINGDRKSQLKEKNRKAQKRFRERQKTKLAESEDKVGVMTTQIERLQAERATLMDRNAILEQVLSAQQSKEREAASQSAGAATFETDAATQQDLMHRHNLQQGLLLTVRPQHIMLSLEQIRTLPWEEHVAIWQDYVNALAALLVQTEGNASSPARERIKQLVQECFCLSAASAMVNPTGSLVFYSLKMDAQSPDGAAEKPGPDYWAHIARELHASPEQRADIKLARQEFLAQLARNNSERQELLQILQASMPTGTDYPMTVTRFFQTFEASSKLRQNLQQQHSSLVQFASGVCQRLNNPFQGATLIVQSFPWSPDILSVINAMAEQDGEPRAADLLNAGQSYPAEADQKAKTDAVHS